MRVRQQASRGKAAGMRWFGGASRRRFGPSRVDRGATSVEYALIAAGVGILAIGSLFALRSAFAASFDESVDAGWDGVVTCGPQDACSALDDVGANNIPNANLLYFLRGYTNISTYVNTPVTTQVPIVSGGTGTRAFTISPSLPSPLTFDAATGAIGGTAPSADSSQLHVVTVTDQSSPPLTAQATFTVAVQPPTVPGAPTGLAVARGAGQLTLTWSPPLFNGGSAITDYRVTVDSGVYADAQCDPTPTSRTCTVSGLTNGTEYTLGVAAQNAVGRGDEATVKGTPLTACTPLTLQPMTFSSGTSPKRFDLLTSVGGGTVTSVTKTSGDGTVVRVANSPYADWTVGGNAAKSWTGTFGYTATAESTCSGTSTGTVTFSKPAGFNP